MLKKGISIIKKVIAAFCFLIAAVALSLYVEDSDIFDLLLAIIFIFGGILLLKKPKKKAVNKPQEEVIDKPIKFERLTKVGLLKPDIDFSTIISRLKEFETNSSEFIVLDLETTGLSSEYERIIEVAAIKFSNNEKVEMFHTLVNPKRKNPL